MHSEQEKLGFSRRLQTALKLAGLNGLSNNKLADRFNLRHPNQSISAQTFHHWLIGRSIPTPDKVATLAKWLETNESWLRYGRSEDENGIQTAEELLLLKYFRMLPPEKQQALIMFLHTKEP
ncbi:transcriptional regulator [Neisseria sp. N95_16]|uniref:Transcriptional regulator n=2 Tax=Neisseriaceae TaxID=481 RepID=A0A5Q3S9A3_9NEIS|nr:transcriptional regulator [Neisseria brasiliensis]PJO09718.1 transcriptional regulator [Neisseria sp. N95_16]PJO77907.1 transcriptional regulator [Neisseria sp. N177_16]QGL26476.1 transcriptional regulator [Neisseria brasiliensis]